MERQLLDLFPPGHLVVDLGCGDGRDLDLLGGRFESALGIDAFDIRMNMRGDTDRSWSFVQADTAVSVPLREGCADAVLANQVIEHIVDPVRFVREIHRILRPGGIVIITTPNSRYVRQLWRLVVRGRGLATSNGNTLDGDWDDGHVHYFTHRDLREVFRRVGFSGVSSQGLVNLERGGAVRKIMDRFSACRPVREFATGNIMVTARK